MKMKNPIEKAKSKAENAKSILKENGMLDEAINHYQNKKYVRKAGRMLWRAVLIALDAVYDVRMDRRTKVYIDDYLHAIAKQDQSLAVVVDNGYNVIHVYMAYDGCQHKPISDEGFRLANVIIDRCANLLGKELQAITT